ncbi:DUF2911 domain-containing protein [Pontibacter sp. CAU 1760]
MKRTIIALAVAATASATLPGCNNATQEQNTPDEPVEATAPEDTVAAAAVQDTIKGSIPSEATVQDTIKGSIPSEATGTIGPANLRISYFAPGVKGRNVWGGLVPYDQVWVTGAHMATSLETDKALVVGGKDLEAGKYAFFTIPGKKQWTVIINKNWEQHLTDDYSAAEDVLRVQVKAEDSAQHQERLKYEIIDSANASGALQMAWGKRKISVPIEVKTQ